LKKETKRRSEFSERFFLFIFTPMNINSSIPLEEGDFYFNDQGYRVFTEQYHLKRGYCCKNGCKHCPYQYNKNIDSFEN